MGVVISVFLLVRFGMLMKHASLITIVFAVSTLLFAQNTKAASTDTAFDGTWSVTVNAHEYQNADGSTALAWVIHFPAEVKNGVLHGEHGTRGAAGWYELDGKMETNGTAILRTNGITSDPEHAERHVHFGTSYEYQVNAHFNGQHGTGKSVGPRIRIFTFVKD